MRKRLSLILATLVAALVAVPAASAASMATLNVVHGIPGATVDVCAGPAGGTLAPVVEDFMFTEIATLELPAGSYDAAVVLANAPCDEALPGLAASGLELPEGVNASVVANLTADGSAFALTVGVNETAKAKAKKSARVTVYHTAAAPAVDIRAGKVFWHANLLRNVGNGDVGSKVVRGGDYTVAVVPAGGKPWDAVAFQRVSLPRQTNTIVYAVGSLADGTFTLLSQRISLS